MPFYGGSDTNFIRNADWFGNGHQVLVTAEAGCMFTRLNCAYTVVQVTQASTEVVEIIELPWVGVACKQFYKFTDNVVSRFLEKLGWQACFGSNSLISRLFTKLVSCPDRFRKNIPKGIWAGALD